MPAQPHTEPIVDMIGARATLASLLLRLAMVALTMGIVWWIGWTIPAPQEIESLHAPGTVEAGGVASQPLPLSTRPSMIPQAQGGAKGRPRSPVPAAFDVNRATEQDFERLPGIGPVLARRIVEYRETRGSFQDVDELRRVKGIGKKTFERIRAFVAVVPRGVRSTGKAA
jgi:competence protein ComEA